MSLVIVFDLIISFYRTHVGSRSLLSVGWTKEGFSRNMSPQESVSFVWSSASSTEVRLMRYEPPIEGCLFVWWVDDVHLKERSPLRGFSFGLIVEPEATVILWNLNPKWDLPEVLKVGSLSEVFRIIHPVILTSFCNSYSIAKFDENIISGWTHRI